MATPKVLGSASLLRSKQKLGANPEIRIHQGFRYGCRWIVSEAGVHPCSHGCELLVQNGQCLL